jgi:lipoprotein-anchoring transpeptidase ErfK/SrfK
VRIFVRLAAGAATGLVGAGGLTAAATPAAAAPAVLIRSAASSSSCPTGPYQKQVEGYLAKLGGYGKVKVDGRQSAADCAAIVKFQKRFGIVPAAGKAGPTTRDVARRLVATKTKACKASKKKGVTTFCVDLTHQTVWVVRAGKVIYKPTLIRSGKKGYATPTGTYRIWQRAKKEYSEQYKVWMPYWQRFVGGIGLHETTTYLHDGWRGSHGCVNLLASDAKKFYGIGRNGMTVKVFGRRPGT